MKNRRKQRSRSRTFSPTPHADDYRGARNDYGDQRRSRHLLDDPRGESEALAMDEPGRRRDDRRAQDTGYGRRRRRSRSPVADEPSQSASRQRYDEPDRRSPSGKDK